MASDGQLWTIPWLWWLIRSARFCLERFPPCRAGVVAVVEVAFIYNLFMLDGEPGCHLSGDIYRKEAECLPSSSESFDWMILLCCRGEILFRAWRSLSCLTLLKTDCIVCLYTGRRWNRIEFWRYALRFRKKEIEVCGMNFPTDRATGKDCVYNDK